MESVSGSSSSSAAVRSWERLLLAALQAQREDREARPAPARSLEPASRVDDPWLLPAALDHNSDIGETLTAASEVESMKGSAVAGILTTFAYNQAMQLDPNSDGRGVLQFKTSLHSLLKGRRMRRTQHSDPSSDVRAIQDFFEHYKEHIKKLEEDPDNNREKLGRAWKTARVLAKVLQEIKERTPAQVPEELTEQIEATAAKTRELEKEKYNIVPVNIPGAEAPILEIQEVGTAIDYIGRTAGLPRKESGAQFSDVFELLQFVFGFQEDNVANQREHVVLLLANTQTRLIVPPNVDKMPLAVDELYKKVLDNFSRWADYVHADRTYASGQGEIPKLVQAALFLLIWGEAANVRFLPECLCYLFHRMAEELSAILKKQTATRSAAIAVGSASELQPGPYAFLENVISPIYQVIKQEADYAGHGTVAKGHQAWRTYDDLNEYFWSNRCFELNWPIDFHNAFFTTPLESGSSHDAAPSSNGPMAFARLRQPPTNRARRLSKTNFVEWRTFWHIFHSFDRLWIFLIVMLQAMVILAFSGSNSLYTLEKVLTIFPTISIMQCLSACTDMMMAVGAYRSMHPTAVLRKALRLLLAATWALVLTYTCIKMLEEYGNSSRPFLSLYAVLLAAFTVPRVIINLFRRCAGLRMQTDKVDHWMFFRILNWFYQEDLYVGRGMYESTLSTVLYSTFWFLVLVCKFLFSYYYQVRPLVTPTSYVVNFAKINYQWRDLVSGGNHNALTVASLWLPVMTIYMLDIQIWYTVLSAIGGGVIGAWWHLGEIRSLGMLRARFRSFPEAFARNLQPLTSFEKTHSTTRSFGSAFEAGGRKNARRFAMAWNEIIRTLREEDYLSNKEVDLLLMPSNSGESQLVQWPLFLLANQIFLAMGLAVAHKSGDGELWKKVCEDEYMRSAAAELYETLEKFLLDLVADSSRGPTFEQRVIHEVFTDIGTAIGDQCFATSFRLKNLPTVHNKLSALTAILVQRQDDSSNLKAVKALQDLYESAVRDLLSEDTRLKLESSVLMQEAKTRPQLFSSIRWPTDAGAAKRLHLLLTVKDSALDVPVNLEARRRLEFFTNSLFMKMPEAPPVKRMLPFCVMTPYYEEIVAYSMKELSAENEDGVSILFYLQKIFPDEWANFLERIGCKQAELESKMRREEEDLVDLRMWASFRGQTLARTVRGMTYYHRALQLLAYIEEGKTSDVEYGSPRTSMEEDRNAFRNARTEALADLKFTYVVTCQIYGKQKERKDRNAAEIFALMKGYGSLRVAYIDEVEVTVGEGDTRMKIKEYYSRLVKVDNFGQEQEIFKVKLPGPAKQGEGKPENQNHAIIFSRGDALQTIDMNQDNYLEEALKMRNLLEEFRGVGGIRKPTILGVREHVFTGSVSSLASFMSYQEMSFVTLGQRFLAYPLKVRMHYGHPDVFDRLFHITRGGISKASKTINISEDIFAGFSTTLRQGAVSHHEYIQVGKGRDVGLNQIALFEAKVASGNGEQMLSRDVYRLGQQFDFFRMLSFYFTSVGFYISTMLTAWCVYFFLYGKVYLALSGVEATLKARADILGNAALQAALSSQFLLQIGVFTAVPMIVVFIVEKGIVEAVVSFITMQLQLASVFFTFSLGTRTHYFGRTILHGGAKYRSTGRGFVIRHEKFAEIYRLYSRSHFVKGLEVAMLLITYLVYGSSASTTAYIFLSISSWFLVVSWCFGPFIFNPSGFEWQKTVQDFDDWTSWLLYTGGVGLKGNMSWETWWEEELSHIRNVRNSFWEVILSLRFFIFQYGIVYSLDITDGNTSIWVYAVSWIVLAGIILLFYVSNLGRTWDAQLQVRLLQSGLFIGVIVTLVLLVILTKLSVGDILASVLVFIPTGWGLLQIAIALRFILEPIGLWRQVRAFARLYDALMGSMLFLPVAVLSWFPFVSTFQSRLMFNQAFSRGLEISLILAGNKQE